jgi:CRISPR/Cas system-associated exonuclease Cas4 (RecB family)
VRPVTVGTAGANNGQEVNAGTLAHRVLERWILAEGYRAADPKAALTEAADACVAELHGAPPSSWRVSRARLIARGMSLVDLIGDRAPEHVLSEIELKDEDLRLRGQLDLLLLGDETVVVDLKTQTLLDEELPEWVEFQLRVYAHLVEKTYGKLPARAEVFSLNRGRREVQITEESIQDALAGLATARAADLSSANPSPEVCRFCDRRLVCEPHWGVVTTWPDVDAVEGAVQRAEHAATGVVALLLETADGAAWVSGIPRAFADVIAGDVIRCVRVRHVETSGATPEWRWRGMSTCRISAVAK